MKKTIFFTMMPIAVFGQQMPVQKLNQEIEKDNPRIVEIFKKIHQNPELGFMETATSELVASEFSKLGYTVKKGIAKTGVVGIMKNGNGPVVMYRADMDANAVKEVTNLPYKSTKIVEKPDGVKTPVAHMCGHDAHVSWMLAAAKVMAANRNLWKGTLIFVGQPAEELIEGAAAMVEDGLYTKHQVPEPDFLYGIHTAPIATGMVAAATGVRMAGTDQLDVTFTGIGGHGSMPHFTKDPVVMAANAIMNYQTVSSRVMDPQSPMVLTVGSVQAGVDNNVIPGSALIRANLRWFTEKDRKTMFDAIERINTGIAVANGLPKELYPALKRKGWSYPLDNSQQLTEVVRKGISDYVNPTVLLTEKEMGATMGSEDFHHLVLNNAKKNYCYVNVGIAEPARFEKSFKERQAPPFNNHNGDFEVDLNSIPYGTKTAVYGLLAIFNHYRK